MMTREEFVRRYAKESDISDEWAELGFIDVAGQVRIALPCACGDGACEGWAMVGAESVLHHLEFNAPEPMRAAYRAALAAAQ